VSGPIDFSEYGFSSFSEYLEADAAAWAARNGAKQPDPVRWLENAADLLAEPDPGPTPFLVDELLVDGCVGAVQGAPKSGKTWLILELAVAIVTGRPAFGRFKVPGGRQDVILVLEESGRAALHRRLGALARGNAIRPEDLAGLHFAANRRVRLDDTRWQGELAQAVERFAPSAVFLDPLARMKMPSRDENAQGDMAVLLDYMRSLRDMYGSTAVIFCHHTGHDGTHLRGSSDLESYWESKVALKRSGDEYDFMSEHREAEAGETHRFRQAWDADTRSLRLRLIDDERREELDVQVADYLEANPEASANDISKALEKRKQDVLEAIRRVKAQVVPGLSEPPGTTPSDSLATGSHVGGSPPFRGEPSGNQQEQVVPADREPPPEEELGWR
jgi:hypothetical protein